MIKGQKEKKKKAFLGASSSDVRDFEMQKSRKAGEKKFNGVIF